MERYEKFLFSVSGVILGLFSALGFFLVRGDFKIKTLVASGHNHMLSFAYGGLLFGLILGKLHVSEKKKMLLSVWFALTYLGPLGLVYAGISGNTSVLTYTSSLFEGSFVLLWFILMSFVLSDTKPQLPNGPTT